jgi:hypothetical protein
MKGQCLQTYIQFASVTSTWRSRAARCTAGPKPMPSAPSKRITRRAVAIASARSPSVTARTPK